MVPGCRGCLLALQHAWLTLPTPSLDPHAPWCLPLLLLPRPRPHQKSVEVRDNAWVESEMRRRIKDTAELL